MNHISDGILKAKVKIEIIEFLSGFTENIWDGNSEKKTEFYVHPNKW